MLAGRIDETGSHQGHSHQGHSLFRKKAVSVRRIPVV